VNLARLFSGKKVIGLSVIAVLVVLAVLASFHVAKSLMPDTKKQANLEKLLDLAPPLGWNKELVLHRSELKHEIDLLGRRFTQTSMWVSTAGLPAGMKLLKTVYKADSVEISCFYHLDNEDSQLLPVALGVISARDGSQIELIPGLVLGRSTTRDIKKVLPKPSSTFKYESELTWYYEYETNGHQVKFSLVISPDNILEHLLFTVR
jgi:hypothetical protein